MLDGRCHRGKCRSGISSRHHFSGDDHQRREQFRASRLIRVPKPPDRGFAAKRSFAAAPEQRNPPRSYGYSSGGDPRASSYYPIIIAGLVLGPRDVGTMAAMLVVGKLIGRVDRRLLLGIGLVLTAWSFYAMTDWTPDISQMTIVIVGVIQGVGLGFLFVPLSTVTSSTLSPELRAGGVGIFSVSCNIGSSVDISVVNSLLTTNTRVNRAEIAQHVTSVNRMFERRGTGAGTIGIRRPCRPVGTVTALPLPLERYRSASPQSIDCYS